MAKKEFTFRGMTIEEVQKLSLKDFMKHIPSRARRSLERGFTEQQKLLLEKIRAGDRVKTHCRDMVVIPEMLGKTIKVHSGKEFADVVITGEMLGHFLGEFALTRRGVHHSAPGIGATRSSAVLSVR